MTERPAKCPTCGVYVKWQRFCARRHNDLPLSLPHTPQPGNPFCLICDDPWHSQPDASPKVAPIYKCPKCSSPIFVRPNKSIVAHYDGSGLRCARSETVFLGGDAPTPERTMDFVNVFDETVGKWLSAALDDEKACAEFKADINAIFAARAKVERDERTPRDERAAFEEWAKENHYQLQRWAGSETYSSNSTRMVWQAWQARAAIVQKEKKG